MRTPRPVPVQLRGREFSTADARAAGLTAAQLRGPSVQRVRRGWYRVAGDEVSLRDRLLAARRALPDDAAASHVTALQLRGVDVGSRQVLHFSTSTDAQTELSDIVLHRRNHRLTRYEVDGVICLGPERSFVDAATLLGVRHLVRAGDGLVAAGFTRPIELVDYAVTRHIDGVVRARRAALLVRERVESVRETDVRLLIVAAGLPEPECNVELWSEDQTWLARVDLCVERWRVVIEYDGWQHERDADQRQKDIYRLERLAAAGWSVVVVTSADLKQPISVVVRVYEALHRRGYRGQPPTFGRLWRDVTRGL